MALFKTKICLFALLATFVYSNELVCRDCSKGCTTNDCIKHKIIQTPCKEVTSARTNDCRWPYYGLSSHTDQEVFKGRIVAYKIQWFSGGWSGWYVPGVNDFDCKYNVVFPKQCGNAQYCPNSLRRMWSYFYDHNFKYIICKP